MIQAQNYHQKDPNKKGGLSKNQHQEPTWGEGYQDGINLCADVSDGKSIIPPIFFDTPLMNLLLGQDIRC